MAVNSLDDNEIVGRAIVPTDQFIEVDGMTFLVRDWIAMVFMEEMVTIECVCAVVVDSKILNFNNDNQIRANGIRNLENPKILKSNDGRTFEIQFNRWWPKILGDGVITVRFLATVELDGK